jgi:hypothetical protein
MIFFTGLVLTLLGLFFARIFDETNWDAGLNVAMASLIAGVCILAAAIGILCVRFLP